MNILIVSKQPYPNGVASTNRIHLYAKGMVQSGHKVHVVVAIPPYDNQKFKNFEIKGIHEGVTYAYTSGTTLRPVTFLQRRFYDLKGLLMAMKLVITKKNQWDALILVETSPVQIVLFKLVCWLKKVVFLTECNEYPFWSKGKVIRKPIFEWIYYQLIMPLYDGILPISHNLYQLYNGLLGNKVMYKVIPVLVDTREFNSKENPKIKSDYIAYTGNLSDSKDGMSNQIRAFANALETYPDLKFVIIGKPQFEKHFQKVQQLIKELNIQDKVIFTGYVSRGDLINYLIHAKALTLFKPKGIQSDYCFPSKIAEYLASARPVVTTATGELINCLQHQENAYLSSPEDENAFANNLIQALSNDKVSDRIGENGRDLAQQNFEYSNQSKAIIDFIIKIQNLKRIKTFKKKAAKV